MKLYKYIDGKCNASGQNIRELREAAGLSQEKLAAKLQLYGLNLNQKSISRIESGDRVIPDFELIYFADILKVPIEALLKNNKKKPDSNPPADSRKKSKGR